MFGFTASTRRRTSFMRWIAQSLGSALALLIAANAHAQVAGTWVLSSTIPVGSNEVATDIAKVELRQDGYVLTGAYSGLLGMAMPAQGTFDGAQFALTVTGQWPTDGSTIIAALTGTFSGATGSGSMTVGPAQGTWTARRPNPGEVLAPSAKVTVDYRSQVPGAVHKIKPSDLPKAGFSLTLANAAKIVPRPAGAWPKAPPGFRVTLYADGFDRPRKILTAPNGDVFLVESDLGQIKVLRGVAQNGKAASVSTFATGLDQPFGMAFYPPGPHPQYLYVGNTGSVVRFPYRNGEMQAQGAPEMVIPDLPAGGQLIGGGHWTRDLAFSKHGESLFVSVGSWSDNDDTDNNPTEVHRANVLEYTPSGRFLRVYASGLRNPVGIALHPRTGQLWTTVNERDLHGNDLVPDYVTHLEPGGFYGWPWFYIGSNPDPVHAGKHPELIGSVRVPDVLMQAHSSPLALAFNDSNRMPREYRDNLFVAQHGSWNRGVRVGPGVTRVPLAQGSAGGEFIDFLTGFVTADGVVWGRPAGVAIGRDGSVLVSDDGSKSVWRVTHSDRRGLDDDRP